MQDAHRNLEFVAVETVAESFVQDFETNAALRLPARSEILSKTSRFTISSVAETSARVGRMRWKTRLDWILVA
jgi:hypothetical protein